MKISDMNLDRLLSMTWEEKWDFVCGGAKDDGKSGEVAVLLGSDPEEAVFRAKAAAELYAAGRVSYIVPSGGVKWKYEDKEISEADLMMQVLVEQGVPQEVIFPDYQARTTVENMIGSTLVIARHIKLKNVQRVIVVTSQFHMQRSIALAKAIFPRKFQVSPYPAIPKETKEEWLSVKENRNRLNTAIRLLKGLISRGVVEDIDL